MSLFDIFNKKHIGETLGSLMDTAKEQASGLTKAAPGGVGGLVGAGALAPEASRDDIAGTRCIYIKNGSVFSQVKNTHPGNNGSA